MSSQRPANAQRASEPASNARAAPSNSRRAQVHWRQRLQPMVLRMTAILSMSGFIFGYSAGSAAGFLHMHDYQQRFGDITLEDGNKTISGYKASLLLSSLPVGATIGALLLVILPDKPNKRVPVLIWSTIVFLAIYIQLFAEKSWWQLLLGRAVEGLGIGALSVITPIYQAELSPRCVRGAFTGSYQLFAALGFFIANSFNYATSRFEDAGSWRFTLAIGSLWPCILAIGILYVKKSPRRDHGDGFIERSKSTIARCYGTSVAHQDVAGEVRDIRKKFEAERAARGDDSVNTQSKPRTAYRISLGVALQVLRQITGGSLFFYFEETIFAPYGISDPLVCGIILGAINVFSTLVGLYLVEHFGRRSTLTGGGAGMVMLVFIWTLAGHFDASAGTESISKARVIVACLFTSVFAASWSHTICSVVPELYSTPSRTRLVAIATSVGSMFNYLFVFFAPHAKSLHWHFGYLFTTGNVVAVFTVHYYLCESQGRSLEEVDTMYTRRIEPRQSETWRANSSQELIDLTTSGQTATAEQTANDGTDASPIDAPAASSSSRDTGEPSASTDNVATYPYDDFFTPRRPAPPVPGRTIVPLRGAGRRGKQRSEV